MALLLVGGFMATTLSDNAGAAAPGSPSSVPNANMSRTVTPAHGVLHNGQYCFAKKVKVCNAWHTVYGQQVCKAHIIKIQYHGCHAYH